MSTPLNDLENKNYLVFFLVAVVVVFLIANVINQEEYPIDKFYATDLLSVIGSFSVIIFGGLLSFKYKARGTNGIAWILFTLSMVSWFLGEYAYSNDSEYNIEDLSTLASDIFFITGYPLFFAFTILYLKPRRNIITRKIIFASSLFSLLVIIPTLYITFVSSGSLDNLTLFLYAIYPILAGVILIPAIVTVFLFFRGQIDLLWCMVLFGIIFFVAGDTAYLISSLDESYYAGHPLNILYVWAYVLFAFGTSSHLTLFKKSK